MREGLTVLETFLSDIEAEIEGSRLEALGVKTVIEKDDCGGMRPHLNLRGVRLLVADADLEKARGILADATETEPGPAWVCPQCGEEIEGGFDACWKCSHQRD